MPPRIRTSTLALVADLQLSKPSSFPFICATCRHASTSTSPSPSPSTSTTPAPTHTQIFSKPRHSPNTPPSHRDPTHRKSQLLRSYVSLLRTTPLIILFQHNNLRAPEWASIRREVANALQKVDDTFGPGPEQNDKKVADGIKLTVIRTNIFEPALRITEYYRPGDQMHAGQAQGPRAGENQMADEPQGVEDEKLDPSLTHALSRRAHTISKQHHNQHPLTPLLTGPLAALTFPTVSPQHVKAALSILAPSPPGFPAPTRRGNPGYYEAATQDGLKKLLLLGARIDGQVFDIEGTRWVGSIDGGIDGLRAQLVRMLQGFGAGITTTLESASKGLWVTLEGRRRMLEEPVKGGEGQKSE